MPPCRSSRPRPHPRIRRPIRSKIVSLHTEKNSLQFAVPGGLIGVGTKIDPTLCRADRMVGQVLGTPGNLPKIYTELEIQVFLLKRLLGVRMETGDEKRQYKVSAGGELCELRSCRKLPDKACLLLKFVKARCGVKES